MDEKKLTDKDLLQIPEFLRRGPENELPEPIQAVEENPRGTGKRISFIRKTGEEKLQVLAYVIHACTYNAYYR